MKKLLLSTALVAVTSMPVLAQNTEEMFRQEAGAEALQASEFIGMRVYRADAVDAESVEGVQEGWDDIGEINDVIFSRDGNVEAVLVDIGGFLGIGENQVAVDMDALQFVSDSATGDQESDFFLVLNAPRDALESAPTYGGMGAAGDEEQTAAASDATQTTEEEASGEAGAAATDEQETAEAGDSNNLTDQAADAETAEAGEETTQSGEQMAETGDTATTEGDAEVVVVTPEAETEGEQDLAAESEATTEGEQELATETEGTDGTLAPTGTQTEVAESDGMGLAREGYVTAAQEDLTADTLTGAAAYDVNDERIGEVSDLLLAEDGKVQAAIVDVGGFLGIGAKPVQLELSKLDILRSEDGRDVRVYISMTEEELEALPEYEN